jgi:hypothetical protein
MARAVAQQLIHSLRVQASRGRICAGRKKGTALVWRLSKAISGKVIKITVIGSILSILIKLYFNEVNMNRVDRDFTWPDVANMSDKELQEFIVSTLKKISISAQRAAMPEETRDSIQASVAKMEAHFPGEFPS